ncbi:MAG: hypothetical protein QNJ94_14495 [Alphaproteobacteria bacterium]|nr:hypothetical protein [Alphaproteobacteria bacterium]
MRSTLVRLAMLAMLAGGTLSLSACNTVEGIGMDIAATARTVKNAF